MWYKNIIKILVYFYQLDFNSVICIRINGFGLSELSKNDMVHMVGFKPKIYIILTNTLFGVRLYYIK